MDIYDVYVGGSLTSATDELKAIFADIGIICQNAGLNAYIPHLQGADPIKHPEITPEKVWELNHAVIKNARVIVAYIGAPSLGTGSELEIARHNGLHIITWWFKGDKVSRMALGNPGINHKIEVENGDDLNSKLLEVLKSYVA